MHQVLLPEKLTQASYKLKQVFNAGGCLLLFTVNVVLTLEWYCVPVYIPSLIVRNANINEVIGINKFYCLRLFVVVYKLVIVVLP